MSENVGKMSPKQRKEQVLELIKELGTNKVKIADRLGVNEITIRRDLNKLAEQVQSIPPERYTLELSQIFEGLESRIKNIMSNVDYKSQLYAINVYVSLIKDKIKVLQDLGAIPKVADKAELTINPRKDIVKEFLNDKPRKDKKNI